MTEPHRPYPPPPPNSANLVFDDGEPLESARHVQQMLVLIDSLEHAWADRRDFYAGGNMFVYFSETQTRKNDFRGPDFFLVLGTDHHERKGWVVWEEGGKAPDVIIELLSETTEHVDRGEKMRIYAQLLKVGEYFLFDPWSGVLEGYELDAARRSYRPKKCEANGRIYCEQAGLWLGKARGVLWGVEVDWLRWQDAEGRVMPMPTETAREAVAHAKDVEARANEAEARASEAEARAKRLEQELAELRARRGE